MLVTVQGKAEFSLIFYRNPKKITLISQNRHYRRKITSSLVFRNAHYSLHGTVHRCKQIFAFKLSKYVLWSPCENVGLFVSLSHHTFSVRPETVAEYSSIAFKSPVYQQTKTPRTNETNRHAHGAHSGLLEEPPVEFNR